MRKATAEVVVVVEGRLPELGRLATESSPLHGANECS